MKATQILISVLGFITAINVFAKTDMKNKFLQIESNRTEYSARPMAISDVQLGKEAQVVIQMKTNSKQKTNAPSFKKTSYVLHFLSHEDAKRFYEQLQETTHEVIVRVHEKNVLGGTIQEPSSLFAWDLTIDERGPNRTLSSRTLE